MKARYLYIGLILATLSTNGASAKDAAGNTATKYSFGIGGQINTNGWKALATYDHQVKARLGHFFQLSFSEVTLGYYKRREGSSLTTLKETSRPYIQGKINSFYSVQFGHGREIGILPMKKTSKHLLCARIQAGIGLGVLVPYYLRIVYDDNSQSPPYVVKDEKYDIHATNSRFLNSSYILGRSVRGRGNHEVSVPPCGFVDAGLILRHASRKKFDLSIIAGTNFSIYFQKVPVMAGQNAVPYYGNVYLTILPSYSWK